MKNPDENSKLFKKGHLFCPRKNPDSPITLEICRLGKIGVNCPLKGAIACCLDCGYKNECKVACAEVRQI